MKRLVSSDLVLELKYKQGNDYYIRYDTQEGFVNTAELAEYIRNTPASERNCQISGGTIKMKSGYGDMPVKRLVAKSFSDPNKDYVEVSFNFPNSKKELNYIHNTTAKFRTLSISDIIPFINLMKECGEIKSYNDETHKITTKFGETDLYNISSGMKCLIVVLIYANIISKFTANVSSCSTEYLKILCRKIVHNNIKLVIHHKDIWTIDTKLKYKGKIYEDGSDLLCSVKV